MAIFKGTVRMRRGPESEFDESKMVSGELAIATDKPVMWFCWDNGKAEKIEGPVTPEKLREYFNEWCVDNPIFIDDTLAVKGKAADAKATGDAIKKLKDDAVQLDENLSDSQKAAPANAVGQIKNQVTELVRDATGKATQIKQNTDEISELKGKLGNLSFSINQSDNGLDITYQKEE